MTQEPYLFKAISENYWKPRGWSEALHVQPQKCKEDQRVASITLSRNATNIIIPSVKPSNIVINHIKERGIEVIAINVYFKPKSDIEEILTILSETLSRIPEETPTIIAGDMNTRHTMWGDIKNTSRGTELLDFMSSQGFETLNKQDPGFTFNSLSNRSSAVDIAFFKNTSNKLHAVFKRRKEIVSDHTILEIVLRKRHISNEPNNTVIPQRFNIKKANWNAFQEKMQEELRKLELLHPAYATEQRNQETAPNSTLSTQRETLTMMVASLTKVITTAAEKAIPKKREVKSPQPW